MKLNPIALAGCLFLLSASIPVRAVSTLTTDTTDTIETSAPIVTFNNKNNVTGSVAVIQAFNAIRENNAAQLLGALNSSQNPINETFSITSNGQEVKMRLIHAAVLSKSLISLSLLISRGARIAAKDSQQKNAAHYAAFGAPDFGNIFDFKPFVDGEIASQMLELLQAEGVDVEAKDIDLRTPLHFAAIAGDPSVINLLVAFSVALDPKDINGYTPTQLAVRAGYLSAIPNLLRRAGATGAATTLDYIVGTKTDFASFVIIHPIATAASVLVAGLAWFGSGLLSGAKAIASAGTRTRGFAPRHDGSLPPPDFGIPQRSIFLGGGGSSGSGVLLGALPPSRSASAPTTPTADRKAAPISHTAVASAASSATNAASDTSAKKSSTKQYQEATDAINTLRRSQDAARVQPALQEAERLLRDVRDQEVTEVRRHLLAAVGALAKQLPDGPDKNSANRIATDYAKKAKRH